jgi:hypothetical protein
MAMGWCQAIGQRIPRPAVAILTKNPQNHPLAVEKKLDEFGGKKRERDARLGPQSGAS